MERPRGVELLRQAVNHILKHPETWDQSVWSSPCRTKFCILGHCRIIGDLNLYTVQEALGLSDEDYWWVLSQYRTLLEIYNFTANWLARHHGYTCSREVINRKELTPL